MPPTRDEAAIVYIEGLLGGSSGVPQPKPTIFVVEDRLRKVKKEDYEPKIVSIGPIHHGKDQVTNMEQDKARFLQEVLDEKQDLTLKTLVEEVGKIEEDARGRYSSEANTLTNGDDFLGTLLLDGCFIIQLVRNYSSKKTKDPILESNTLIQIIHDLLLFENQLPFFILTAIFDKIKTGNPDDNLRHLILFLVEDIVPWLDASKSQLLPDPDHLLGLVYGCVSTKIPSNPKRLLDRVYLIWTKIASKPKGGEGENSSERVKKTPVIHINSASELKEVSGIHLRMSEDNSLTFAGKVLKLPSLQVYGETESLLRNLMAYEQLKLGDAHQKHEIDYVFFLHCLVRSDKDVEILRYRGIINNYLGSDDKIRGLLDRLGTNFMRSAEYSYSNVFKHINIHCSRQRSKWMATLCRTHFNSPWSVIKVLAATVLLVIAATQVVFAILSYKKKMTTTLKN